VDGDEANHIRPPDAAVIESINQDAVFWPFRHYVLLGLKDLPEPSFILCLLWELEGIAHDGEWLRGAGRARVAHGCSLEYSMEFGEMIENVYPILRPSGIDVLYHFSDMKGFVAIV
jgi:hypothetical protein